MRVMMLLLVAAITAAADEPTVAELIARLGSVSWQEREAATAALVARGESVRAAIEPLRESADAEIAQRARSILDQIDTLRAADRATATERERAANQKVYDAERTSLRERHAGTWIVVADGRIAAMGPTMDAALDASGAATRASLHRFVFRAGDEDPPGTPWHHGSLRHGDVGNAHGLPFEECVSGPAIEYRLAGEKGFRMLRTLRLSLPGGTEVKIAGPTRNSGQPWGICLAPDAARSLGTARFEWPGEVEGSVEEIAGETRVDAGLMLGFPARRAWIRVALDGLDAPVWGHALLPRVLATRAAR